jgi:hypothetical protein
MKAELLYRFREDFSDDAILEAVIWRVPKPVPGSRHQDGREMPYVFTTPEKLIDDFLSDINKLRSGS